MSTGQYAGWGRRGWGTGPWGEDEPHFEITITGTNSPVEAGNILEVDVEVENLGGSGGDDVQLTVEEQ